MSLPGSNYCLNLRLPLQPIGWKCLQHKSTLIPIVVIWGLGAGKLQALTKDSVPPELFENGKLPSALTKQIPPITTHEIQPTNDSNPKGSSVQLHYSSKPPPLQMAAPENFNPGLRVPSSPPPPPPAQPSSLSAPTPSSTPVIVLESITTDFHRDEDNFDQRNQFIEPTARLIAGATGAYWTSGSNTVTSSVIERQLPTASIATPTVTPATPPQIAPTTTHQPVSTAVSVASPVNSTQLSQVDRVAGQLAWRYFERNWNAQTGLVNAVDNYPWTTLWDQGSAILGIHAARQLGLVQPEQFTSMVNRLLQTLESLPLPATGLPNKAYSTRTAEMRRLDNTPDLKGSSGWSALDTARFLLALHVLRSHYPQYHQPIDRIVKRWQLSKLVQDGWLQGGIPNSNGQIRTVQEGRLGYEQYAAYSLQLWGIEAKNALYHAPVKTIEVDDIPLQIDQRNLANSGATNYLTNEPYLLWGLELGWNDAVKPQVLNLLQVQAQRFERTRILTAVNEESLDRPPYFLYYSVYADGQPWNAVNTKGKTYPQLRFLSTKAAFAWRALMPNDSYASKLRAAVNNLAVQNRGYFSGRYENSQLGVNASVDVNTNAVILESLLYQARGNNPLAF